MKKSKIESTLQEKKAENEAKNEALQKELNALNSVQPPQTTKVFVNLANEQEFSQYKQEIEASNNGFEILAWQGNEFDAFAEIANAETSHVILAKFKQKLALELLLALKKALEVADFVCPINTRNNLVFSNINGQLLAGYPALTGICMGFNAEKVQNFKKRNLYTDDFFIQLSSAISGKKVYLNYTGINDNRVSGGNCKTC